MDGGCVSQQKERAKGPTACAADAWSDADVAEGYLHEWYAHDYCEYEDATAYQTSDGFDSWQQSPHPAPGLAADCSNSGPDNLGAWSEDLEFTQATAPAAAQDEATSPAMLVLTGCRTTPLLRSLGAKGTRCATRAGRSAPRRMGNARGRRSRAGPARFSRMSPDTPPGFEDDEHVLNMQRERSLAR